MPSKDNVMHEVADKVTEAIVDLSQQVEELADRLEGIHETLTGMAESLALLVMTATHNYANQRKE
jgi:hypothetical protein